MDTFSQYHTSESEVLLHSFFNHTLSVIETIVENRTTRGNRVTNVVQFCIKCQITPSWFPPSTDLVFKVFWDFERSVVQSLTSDLTANSWLCLISRSDLLRPTLRFSRQCNWYLITFHYANQSKIFFSLFSFNTVFIFYINCGSPYMPNYYIWIDCNFCGYKE